MRVLFVGDIVGPEATAWLCGRLPGMRRELGLDLVIVNAENCTVIPYASGGGFGMRADLVAALFASGVDVITSGNHAWDSPDASAVLTQPRVLRPHNLPPRPDRPGVGVVTIPVGDETVTVVNLADAGAIADATPPYAAWREIAAGSAATGEKGDVAGHTGQRGAGGTGGTGGAGDGDGRAGRRETGLGTVIVDLHADSAFVKHGFAHAADGEVAAVLGTHTHEPTSTLHLLPGGTALVVEVGMTGPTGGYQGTDPACFTPESRGGPPGTNAPLALASGPLTLAAVLLTIESGRTTAIERVE